MFRLKGQLEAYCDQLPVLGYNSSSYDLNLIKKKLSYTLGLHQQPRAFVVKKANKYMCISCDKFKFLDAMQFVAPGTSYTAFLSSYKCSVQKGFFPYEWFDSAEKLSYPCLPPIDAFWSELKGSNVLGEDGSGIEETYTNLQNIWKKEGMATMGDFLRWYNNLDVMPFVEAIEKMLVFYRTKHIDLLKNAISVPGIARRLLFKTARREHAHFALFSEKNKDLYQKIKNNMIGGPSIIFTR